MPVKTAQLKKFLVKDLKAIIKEHKLGKVSKLKKPQLLALILNASNSKDIMSKLTPKLKKKKKFSAKQLAAQQRFREMAKAKKDAPKQKDNLDSKGMSELRDLMMDKGLSVSATATKAQMINSIRFGKQNLKSMGGRVMDKELTKPVSKEIVKKATTEIKKVMTDMIDKETDKIGNKKKLQKVGKKAFLDEIFGAGVFNLKREIKDIVNEATDEQLEIFLSFSKAKKREMLEKRFSTSRSIGTLIKTFIK